MRYRIGIEVRGIVQGVGFRPYVYRLAHDKDLTGSIRNSEAGVLIQVQGTRIAVASFLETLPRKAPPLAQLHEVRSFKLEVIEEAGFVILESTRTSRADTLIAPDIGTCSECIAELFDPADRRYRYPFINCTNCGPRFTITRGVPYDRSNTSMTKFTLCAVCQAEYDDPLDRRFHAQPNACWDCGPQAQLVDRNGVPLPGDPVAGAIQQLQHGSILAIKGLGGFHLAVDASQPDVVAELRRRKHRGEKPFALMVASAEAAARVCHVSDVAARLLESPQRPIVLLPKQSVEFDALAPDGHELGVFLPYTPLHHLLLSCSALPAIVMTSGNLTDEPIAIDNQEAVARLGSIADFFLLHNRDILLRCDDSVLRSFVPEPQFIRRSRGFVPAPILLGREIPTILAVGGELKNAICISRGSYAFPGQHIGDLQELSAYEFFQESIRHFESILEVHPTVIAHDLHPGYLSTQWARLQPNVRLIAVQHHHAHIASCIAEHRLDGSVIGIALDGTGYGTDGCVWGGEVLVASRQRFERAAHFAYVPMPGGEKAIHEPWRMAVSYLWQAFGPDWRKYLPAATVESLPAKGITLVEQLIERKNHLTLSSSCGRLFDAVAALACNRMFASYEAQAAIVLEACCDPSLNLGAYPFSIKEVSVNDTNILTMDASPLFAAIAEDLRHNTAPGIISRRFHNGLVDVLTAVTLRTSERTGLRRVCLSGGVFQNAVLSQDLKAGLTHAGFEVYTQIQMPPGDGGLSLGQLAIATGQCS